MKLREDVLVALLEKLDALDEAGDTDAARLRAHLLDDVLESLTPSQRVLLDRWHSYVCQKCGATMRTDTRTTKRARGARLRSGQ